MSWLKTLNRAVLVMVLSRYTRETLLTCYSLLVWKAEITNPPPTVSLVVQRIHL
jgi:predicted metal-binding transcription factor (methanogenesis marker protein 9)